MHLAADEIGKLNNIRWISQRKYLRILIKWVKLDRMDELEKEILKSSKNQPKAEAPPTTTNADSVSSNENKKKEGKWGYDLYPERKGNFTPSMTRTFFTMEGREYAEKIRCERNVYNCVLQSPLVKLMMGALKTAGWWVSPRIRIFARVDD